ncbi:hypothetical protein ACLQ2R_03230 [Streptosporangium sp. DT93]|uniref:hypothetical protein n=1 Tax=Streptosporangium sp. DT93 TaxID=3393428 RepID=UPI003CF2BC07
MTMLPTRPGRLAVAAAAVGQAVIDLDLDRWDVICTLGMVSLFAGLWVWAGLGIALSAGGALLLALGIAGARASAAADTRALAPATQPATQLAAARRSV